MITESAMANEAIALTQNAEDLLEAAVRDHSRLVFRIAYSVLRNPAEAEDAAQETFLRALRYGKKFVRIEDPRAWLARVAWRVAVERKDRGARAGTMTSPVETDIPSRGTGADLVLLEQERSTMLDRLIATLPDSLRDPLVLSTLEELTPREVAATLGISEAAVRSRAFRARQILRERMTARMDARK